MSNDQALNVVGLISGTSVDAMEAVACRINGSGEHLEFWLLSHVTLPFTKRFAHRVITATTIEELCKLNFELGELFAQAALAAMGMAGLNPADVDVIGSHGQTMAHQAGATLQISEASVIAERTGVPVVSDFRTRDVAAGGQGAPLVPYADWVLFRRPGRVRALQNIGGIANVSVVSDRLEDTLAFDTGPGNMLIDALVRRATHGKKAYDHDGRMAMAGKPIPSLLRELGRHPFFKRKPPRSAGREQFGDALADSLWARFKKKPNDLIATATAFTIEATAHAYERWVLPKYKLEGIYLSGGGSRNPVLRHGLASRLAPLRVATVDNLGFPEGAKEAACFAILAAEFINGRAQNIPQATGAKRSVVMGKLTPA